jgi:uncharacterized protein YqeY
MLHTELDSYIAEARRTGNKSALKVLQLIKAEFQKYLTSSKDAKLDEVQEAKILMKMRDQWIEELNFRDQNGRDVTELNSELGVLIEYIPELPSNSDVEEYTAAAVTAYKTTKPDGYSLSMRDMKPLMAIVREKFPLADGKVISKVLQGILK